VFTGEAGKKMAEPTPTPPATPKKPK
jgi:hypothetical protein